MQRPARVEPLRVNKYTYGDSPTKQVIETRAKVAALLEEQLSRLSRELGNLELPRGMTPERLSTLTMIDRRGPISMTALADRELVRPPTMSRMVSTLVDNGLVKRSADKDDGRGVLLTTTTKGRRAYHRALQQRLRRFGEALAGFNAEELLVMRTLAAELERFTLRRA
jgi:DNA-binding MarR family transcriptional regulator